MSSRIMGALCVSALVVLAPAPASSATEPLSYYAHVGSERIALTTGSVVTSGTLVNGECQLAERVAFGAINNDAPVRLRLQFDGLCQLVVTTAGPDHTDEAALGAGPIQVLDDADGAFSRGDALLEPRARVARRGLTELTILEQFGITAYELHLEISGFQRTDTGDLDGGALEGYCYVSGFPGNEIRDCYGNMNQRAGSYIEGWAFAEFDNNFVGGPNILAYVSHTITRSNVGGYCEIVEGSLPPLWSADCKIDRVA